MPLAWDRRVDINLHAMEARVKSFVSVGKEKLSMQGLIKFILTTVSFLYRILITDVTKQDTKYGNVEPESLPVHRDRNTTCIEVCGKRLLNFKPMHMHGFFIL